MNATENISDAELRKMRDAVYPANCPNQIQSDEAWDAVKNKWRNDVAWLLAEYKKVINQL